MGMDEAQTVVVGDKVYCGGGGADGDDNEYRVFCYIPSKDSWNSLPHCDVCYFGLSQVRGKLVTVGGKRKSDDEVTNEVYEFDEVTLSWKRSIPPMPTARDSPAVLSHHSTLTVAGGDTGLAHTSVVEVFRDETSQWYTTEPLPFSWDNPSSLLINNRWYLLGGEAEDEYSNRAVCAHIDLHVLLQKALSRDQAFTDRDNTNSAGEILPDTPHPRSAAATFGASLLAMGGTTVECHVYSPCSNEWIHISDLPALRMTATTAILSPTELLVIGGWNNGRQNSVYKGRLQIV